MTGASIPLGEPWLDEGRRAASVLDTVGSAIVVGRDIEAAAWVALGMARVQAERRRVAVADLVGELGPLQSLVDPEGDQHGISDSFLYGVSLNRIAHQADESGNLFVLPSGSEAVAVEEVFRSERWRRLASGFREVGALLLLVAHADTPGLDALAGSVEGVVIVGDASGALADAPPPLVVIAPTRRRPVRHGGEAAAAAASQETPRLPRRAVPPRDDDAPPDATPRPWLRWAAIAAAAVAAAIALGFYLLPKRTGLQGDVPPAAAPVRPDTAQRSAPNDSVSAAGGAALGDSVPPAATGPLVTLTVANPEDSSNAVPYSVYVTAANTPDGATRALDADVSSTVPVIALTAVLEDGRPAYRMLVGAHAARGGADSLLGTLRRRGVLGASSGIVLRTPYALRVADGVPLAEVPARVQSFARRQVAVYPLSRGDGTVALYAGAFESPEQAAWLARALAAAGVTPTLVYRIGRSL